ncbi:hypothetical protein ANACOL_00289 [Anaerotruncus colihominis DSM 17241]|uniref:Uncharacterized protein n=1 Tax=Anaerotruncus colihominis DSM 17241 TaxID=445972 RepID=B0P6B7_9FIRM|nr:hypothetical protein ANACOL_00289 [Anaerotruncus colihominis DSM 17241]
MKADGGRLRPTYPVHMDQEYGSPCGNAWGVGRKSSFVPIQPRCF